MRYYIYRYNRIDGSPYYIGRGTGTRAYKRRQGDPSIRCDDPARIEIVRDGMSLSEANALEISLIAHYGRKDLGTGILRNRTDGGDGGATTTGTRWVTDGSREMLIERHQEVPEGYQYGRCGSVFNDPKRQREFSVRADVTARGKSIKKAWADGKMAHRVLPAKRASHTPETIAKLSQPVTRDGVSYPSCKALAEAYGVSRGMVSYWIKRGIAHYE